MKRQGSPWVGKILIVEDDQIIATTIKLYLERDGHEVVLVDNGRDALQAARHHAPALIVLDLMPPKLNGLDVCRTHRAEPDVYLLILPPRTPTHYPSRALITAPTDTPTS